MEHFFQLPKDKKVQSFSLLNLYGFRILDDVSLKCCTFGLYTEICGKCIKFIK